MTPKYDPQKHHRRSVRLIGYDYAEAGAYYFTIVAQNRACLFGTVVNSEMLLNDAGKMFHEQWIALPERFPNIELDEFFIMPNHVHGILLITDKPRRGDGLSSPSGGGSSQIEPRRGDGLSSPSGGATPQIEPPGDDGLFSLSPVPSGDEHIHDPTLGKILGAWKSIVTNEYIKGVHQKAWQPFDSKLFQRSYWEHIIRNDRELDAIREYILNNPPNWQNDEHNPAL